MADGGTASGQICICTKWAKESRPRARGDRDAKNNNGPVWTRRYSTAVDYKYYGGRIICMLNSRNRIQTYIMFRAFTLLINYAQSLIEQSKSPGHPIVVWFRL